MAEEYTPTVEQWRESFRRFLERHDIRDPDDLVEEHDRMIAQVRAQAKAEALIEFADSVRFPNDWILFRDGGDGHGVTVGELLRETAAHLRAGL